MNNLNKVLLTGTITKDVELRTSTNGKSYAFFSIAVNTQFSKDKKRTDFIGIKSWEKKAEAISKYLKKGSRIMVEGVLETYNNQLGVRLTEFYFIDKKSDTPAWETREVEQVAEKQKTSDNGGFATFADIDL